MIESKRTGKRNRERERESDGVQTDTFGNGPKWWGFLVGESQSQSHYCAQLTNAQRDTFHFIPHHHTTRVCLVRSKKKIQIFYK